MARSRSRSPIRPQRRRDSRSLSPRNRSASCSMNRKLLPITDYTCLHCIHRRMPRICRSLSPRPSRKPLPPVIRVGRLTKNVTVQHLDEIFDVYGKIVDIDLPIIKRREF